ncbi:hypothetical protein BH10ACT4_BH10ACT4_09350 [soil metagenome]
MSAVPPPAPSPYTAAPVGPRTNTLAIVALILGIFIPLGGIICGHIALGQIKRTGEAGHGLALAGTIIGYALTALGIIVGLIYVVAIAALVSTGNNY